MSRNPNTQKKPHDKSGHRAFFGRVAGKRLHRGQQLLFEELLPELEIILPENGRFETKRIPGRRGHEKILEIGYGGGEHLARLAMENPETDFIGCEVFTGGIGKMLQKIKTHDIGNISLFTSDAYRLLKALPDASIAKCHLLYPDPWPKTRHNKRRFVSPTTLEELARVMTGGGRFYFATDIEDYANWTLAHMLRQNQFEWQVSARPGFWHVPFAGWQPTRYEIKARRQGRNRSFYLSFVRV